MKFSSLFFQKLLFNSLFYLFCINLVYLCSNLHCFFHCTCFAFSLVFLSHCHKINLKEPVWSSLVRFLARFHYLTNPALEVSLQPSCSSSWVLPLCIGILRMCHHIEKNCFRFCLVLILWCWIWKPWPWAYSASMLELCCLPSFAFCNF